MADANAVRVRLRAYIHPLTPTTAEELAAFDSAVVAQIEFENENEAPAPGVSSFSNDGVSVSYDTVKQSSDYNVQTICPTAYAILKCAGLLPVSIPTARRF